MLRKSKPSSLQRVLLGVAFIVLLITTGCQKRNEVIAGLEIPIPQKMTKNPDKVFDPIPGFQDGQASYQGKVTPKEILIFIKKSWRLKVGNPRPVSPAMSRIRSRTPKVIDWFWLNTTQTLMELPC